MLEKIYLKAEEDWKKARIAILQFFAQAMQQGQQILNNTMQQIEGIVHRDLEKIVGLEDDLKRDLEAVHAAYEDAAAKSAAFLAKVQAALVPKVEAPAGTVIDATAKFGSTAPSPDTSPAGTADDPESGAPAVQAQAAPADPEATP